MSEILDKLQECEEEKADPEVYKQRLSHAIQEFNPATPAAKAESAAEALNAVLKEACSFEGWCSTSAWSDGHTKAAAVLFQQRVFTPDVHDGTLVEKIMDQAEMLSSVSL